MTTHLSDSIDEQAQEAARVRALQLLERDWGRVSAEEALIQEGWTKEIAHKAISDALAIRDERDAQLSFSNSERKFESDLSILRLLWIGIALLVISCIASYDASQYWWVSSDTIRSNSERMFWYLLIMGGAVARLIRAWHKRK